MSPTGVSVPRWTSGGLWPTQSRAEVVFAQGEKPAAVRITRRLFGKCLRAWQYAGLAGAPDNARVEVGTYQHGLYLDMSDTAAGRYRAILLVRSAEADLVIVEDAFHIHVEDMQRRGLGLRVFHRQLENAKTLGVKRMETVAGRRHGENGYYTWPRFGFDGPLPEEINEKLPLGLERAQTVLDLIDSEKGRLWWREHGDTIEVAFDVAEGSRSRKVFERYVRNKLKRDCPAAQDDHAR